MNAYEKTATTTAAQDREIAKQAAYYETDECPCAGLHAYRIYSGWWVGDSSKDYVSVDFTYIYEDGSFGLETTVFNAAGEVIDAQDFG